MKPSNQPDLNPNAESASTMYRSRIRITLRPSILDPQGKAVGHAIETLGVGHVHGVRVGKYIELLVDEPTKERALSATEEVCKKLLANPVMEDYVFEVEQV
jgi:phosphoribosylformylglycinamidine synthase PurS subunit